jgi:biotin carboxylase
MGETFMTSAAHAESSTILCITSYHKGAEFMRQCKKQGWNVILLTSKSLEGAEWPRESIDEIFYIPDINKEWNMNDVVYGVSFMARSLQIDRIVALDDFDVEKAAALREHVRMTGMGDTTARHFRDKLAMRVRASETGIAVPDFVHILNYNKIKEFLSRVRPPYVLKPRLQAGAIGIKKISSAEELWRTLDVLADKQSFYLLEKFIPGEIYHVDSIIYEEKVLFSSVCKYGLPPMEVAHEGRVFSSTTVAKGSEERRALQSLTAEVLRSLGMVNGVSHTEFIKAAVDGRFYFLETSARVGGAHIVELVEAATGLNLWAEWAKIETAGEGREYVLPKHRNDYAGLLISLARQEWPDLSSYNAPEVVWKLNKRAHAGLIIRSSRYERVEELLKEYTESFYRDFFASQPLPEKAVE